MLHVSLYEESVATLSIHSFGMYSSHLEEAEDEKLKNVFVLFENKVCKQANSSLDSAPVRGRGNSL
jgi:hypothetical protein